MENIHLDELYIQSFVEVAKVVYLFIFNAVIDIYK